MGEKRKLIFLRFPVLLHWEPLSRGQFVTVEVSWALELGFWLAYKGQPGVQRNNQGKGRPVLAFSEGRNESRSSALLSCQAG